MTKLSEESLAYFATLVALVFILVIAMLIGALFPAVLNKVEAFGFGTVTGGLIGLMRMPRARATIDASIAEPLLNGATATFVGQAAPAAPLTPTADEPAQ